MLPLTFLPRDHASALSPTLLPPQPAHNVVTMVQMHDIMNSTTSESGGAHGCWELLGPALDLTPTGWPASIPPPSFCFVFGDPAHLVVRSGTDIREFELPALMYLPLPDPRLQHCSIHKKKGSSTRVFLGSSPIHKDDVLIILETTKGRVEQPVEPKLECFIFCSQSSTFAFPHYYSHLTPSQLQEAYSYARSIWLFRT
jgi:hypothetical protein